MASDTLFARLPQKVPTSHQALRLPVDAERPVLHRPGGRSLHFVRCTMSPVFMPLNRACFWDPAVVMHALLPRC